MPTYVYACKSCGERFEVVQKMSDAPLTDCRSCDGQVRRVIFPPAVVYKGTGFYVTDYKNGGSSSSSSSSSSEKASESKSETKSDSNSSTATDTKSEAKSNA